MKFGIVVKEEDKNAHELTGRVREYLESKGQRVLAQKNLKGADFIITFGGDGTLIHTACEYAPFNIPFVGINTGNLGFLTAVEANDWQKAIENLLKGKVFISERMILEAKVEPKSPADAKALAGKQRAKESEIFRAVNEAAIKGFLRIVTLEIAVGGEKFLKVVGDGVIIAGQTGSTAYSLSSGGPIVDPNLDCFLVTPINPIGLPIPSVVLSPKDRILVKVVKGDDVALVIDGQAHQKLTEGDEVEIRRGKYNVKLVYFNKHHFVRSLNAKFGLGNRVR